MLDFFKNLWFEDPKAKPTYINETAVRIRAGILLIVPLYMGLTLFDVAFTSHWIVDGNTAVDSYDTDWDDNIIYHVDAIKRTYNYTIQTWVLFYAAFDMLAGMTVFTSRFSPTIIISTFLARHQKPVWKPLLPKRFAWTIGVSMISLCLAFFHPDTLANWVNAIVGKMVLPNTYNYLSYWIPLAGVWICIGFMWMEAILGFCVGCKVHSLLVLVGVLKEECHDCNNIDWDEIARKHAAKKATEEANTAQ